MSDPYHDRFSGIARLYGSQALERFRHAHVMIVGIGGVGCWAAECLARSGVGKLTLVDADDICVTNTNRQIHALDGTYGRPKVAAMAQRLRLIHPEIEIVEYPEFFSARNAEALLEPAPDAVIDAIDAVKAKCLLLAECRQRKIPAVACGAAGGRRDPTAVRVMDLSKTNGDSLLQAVRRRLRDEHDFPKAPQGWKVKKFGIEAVCSEEAPYYPTCDGGVSHKRPDEITPGIKCDAGYGTATQVVSAFGMIAAGRVLEKLAKAAEA